MKKAKSEIRKLHTYLGRVYRDIERQIKRKPKCPNILKTLLHITKHVLSQRKADKDKIYSIHEPGVECISKGKTHKKYEFGCKTSIVLTHKEGFVLSMQALHGKPYDGHTLKMSLEQAEVCTGKRVKKGFVDRGYKGHQVENKEIYMSGERGLSRHYKNLLKRRQAIEPHIGHMKNDGKLNRNYLKGKFGDKIHAVLCGIGHNLRLIFHHLCLKLCST